MTDPTFNSTPNSTSAPIFDLSNQVAIVTGTSRGLGQYLARALANAGADLVLTSRDSTALKPFEDEIKAMGRRVVSLLGEKTLEGHLEESAEGAALGANGFQVILLQ